MVGETSSTATALPFAPNDLSDGRAALDDGAPFRIALQGVG